VVVVVVPLLQLAPSHLGVGVCLLPWVTIAVLEVIVAVIGLGVGPVPQFVHPTILSALKSPAETAMLLTVKGRTLNWVGAAMVTLATTFQVTCLAVGVFAGRLQLMPPVELLLHTSEYTCTAGMLKSGRRKRLRVLLSTKPVS